MTNRVVSFICCAEMCIYVIGNISKNRLLYSDVINVRNF